MLCVDNKWVIVVSNQGASVLLIYTLVSYLYCVVMLLVFFYIPKRYGLALTKKPKIVLLNTESLITTLQGDEEHHANALLHAIAAEE